MRDVAQSGPRDHGAVEPGEGRLEFGRSLAGVEVDECDLQVEGVVHFRRPFAAREDALREFDPAVRMNAAKWRGVQGAERIAARRVHLANLRAPVNHAERVARLSMHDRDDFAEVRGRYTSGAEEVHRGVGGGPVARPLRTDHDDGGREVAQHEGKRRGREVQCVGAVRDDHAGSPGFELLCSFPRETLPVLRLQVLAVDAVNHPGTDVADVQKFRDAEDELLCGDGGMDGAGAVVDVRRDGPARAEPGDGGLVCSRGREVPFWSGHRRFGRHLNGLDVPDGDPDIIPAWELQREDVLAAEAVVRHERTLVAFALRLNDDRVAMGGFRTIQDGPDAGRVVHGPRNRPGRYGLCAANTMPSAHDGSYDETHRPRGTERIAVARTEPPLGGGHLLSGSNPART